MNERVTYCKELRIRKYEIVKSKNPQTFYQNLYSRHGGASLLNVR